MALDHMKVVLSSSTWMECGMVCVERKRMRSSAGNVLCRSLGYDRAFAVLQHGGFGDDTEAFFDGISCPATQSSYQKCRLFKYRSNYCSKDFGHLSISCDIRKLFLQFLANL